MFVPLFGIAFHDKSKRFLWCAVSILAAAICSSASAAAQNYHTISTYAGPAPPVPGIDARGQVFGRITSTISDGAGGVYVATGDHRKVYRIDAKGVLTIVAGNGSMVASGDGGPAILAGLYPPLGVAADNRGNLFNGVEGQRFPPSMSSYVAVKLYGPGHVVAYNSITDFHDGINVETYGNPDGSVASGPGILDGPKYPTREYWDRRPVAIDFYSNIISNSHDNPIEADGSMHNIRIMRNMLINHPSHALCNQPTLGGPVYWIRNVAYHLPGGSTRLTNGAAGAVFYNNTILSETVVAGASNVHWRNNLFLGENSGPAIFAVTTFTNYSSSDYNGFRPNPNAMVSFEWNSPPAAVAADFTGPGRAASLETRRFKTLADYSQSSGQDRNSITVDYDVFVNVPRLDAQDVRTVQKIYSAGDFDFRLKAGSAAIDRGTVLPNVTDFYSGRAPDLGALETGAPPPLYGPRP